MTQICTTTDIVDDLARAGRLLSKEDLDAMMAYAASLGSKRHEWVLDTIWTLYDEDSPVGYDFLAEACDAAHRHGMRFDVVFKPFEGGMVLSSLPHDMPRPEGVPLLEDMTGLIHAVRPFVAAHPEMRMARRAEDVDPGGRLTAIRLIKNDDAPAPLRPDEITLLTSSRNGGFEPYKGPMTWKESVEWRRLFPYRDTPSRVLTLDGLELPADANYLMLQFHGGGGEGEFTNAIENLVELVNERGEVLPSTPSLRRFQAKMLFERLSRPEGMGLTRYAQDPQVREQLRDKDAFMARCADMHRFDAGWENADLCQIDELVVARGKPRHVIGRLNPIYPEVREHWLEHVRFCIDRGVDGVNMRAADHNRPCEPWAFGFNEPTVQRAKDPSNVAEITRINGEAYTQFLRDAAELLHSHGKELGVHVHGLMLRHDDKAPDNLPISRMIEWQWETWIRELADYVEFRGAQFLRPENIQQVTDRIGLATREAGIPFIYQCTRGTPVHFDGPHHALKQELAWVQTRPHITEYNLYETAGYTRYTDAGGFEGSPDIAELVRGA